MSKLVSIKRLSLGLVLSIPIIAFALLAISFPSSAAGTIYVNQNVVGSAEDGTSWENAYTDLQSALTTATAGDEIWVAKGRYIPGAIISDTFQLVEGVSIYGGFVATETDKSQRDWLLNITILSGDIGGDDTRNSAGLVISDLNQVGDNSRHVISATGVTNSTIVDGFFIEAGQADGTGINDDGGGLLLQNSSPVLQNLGFVGNAAGVANSASGSGGGIYADDASDPTLKHVEFDGNRAEYGGGMFVGGEATLEEVVFAFNYAYWTGGGLYISGGSATLTNGYFVANEAVYLGGAIDNEFSDLTLINVGLFGNRGSQTGGGLYNNDSTTTMINTTIAGNYSATGGGLNIDDGSAVTMTNSIVWGNDAPTGPNIDSQSLTASASYSILEGSGGSSSWNGLFGTDGGNNLDADPLFTNPIPASSSPTLDGFYGPLAGSPAIDAGSNTAFTTATSVTTDIFGQQRIQNSLIDMGAIEYNTPTTPIATDDSYSVAEDGSFSGNVISDDTGMGMDSDPNGDTLTATLVTDANYGTLGLSSNGSFSYIPEADYYGPDQFVYQLTDGNDPTVVTATVSISVTAVNDAPVAGNDLIDQGTQVPVTILYTELISNDIDIDSVNLNITDISDPSHGSFLDDGSLSGTISYTPTLTEGQPFVGTATFTYTVSDGELTDSASVTIRLDDGGSNGPKEYDSGFRPEPNGYSFPNYPETKSPDAYPAPSTLIDLYGAPAVCKVGSLNSAGDDCVLDSQVLGPVTVANGESYGQAYGMVVTAMRMFLRDKIFGILDDPTDFEIETIDNGLNDGIAELEESDELRGYIGRFTHQQVTEPIDGGSGWVRNLSIAEAINLINAELEDSDDPYLMILYSSNSNSTAAIPLFPYYVRESDDGYEVFVYDPNYPLEDDRVVEVDLKQNSWSYDSFDYSFDGTDNSSLVDLRSLSGHRAYDIKPLGSTQKTRSLENGGLDLFAVAEPSVFSSGNGMDLSMISLAGFKAGYSIDPYSLETFKDHDEDEDGLQCMRGADGRAHIGFGSRNFACGWGANFDYDPSEEFGFAIRARVEFRASELISDTQGHTFAFMTDIGDSFALMPQEGNESEGTLNLSLSPTGKSATVDPEDGSGKLPILAFATRGKTVNQPSYTTLVTAQNLSDGAKLSAEIDPDSGMLVISDTDSVDLVYQVAIKQTNSDGTVENFESQDVKVDGTKAMIDLTTLTEDGIEITIDKDGDGFSDETAQVIPNTAPSQGDPTIYLPVIRR